MKKKITMMTVKEIRRRNMESWTEEDRRFYEDFLDAVFAPQPDDESKPEQETAEDKRPDQKPVNPEEDSD